MVEDQGVGVRVEGSGVRVEPAVVRVVHCLSTTEEVAELSVVSLRGPYLVQG